MGRAVPTAKEVKDAAGSGPDHTCTGMLARGKRAGAGLVLMAASMNILMLAPQWGFETAGAAIYTIGFLSALWLPLGPEGVRRDSRH